MRVWAFLLFLAVLETPLFAIEKSYTLQGLNWHVYKSSRFIFKKHTHDSFFEISKRTDKDKKNRDLYLDFESNITEPQNYRLIHSAYLKNTHISISGRASAKFYYPNQFISLLPLSTSIFAPGKVPGSFTIDFWIYVYQPFNNQYILRYMGSNPSDESDRNNYGFSIKIQNRKIVYRFENFFWNIKGEPFSRVITEQNKISLQKWEHHAISFNIMTGKLACYKNGVEQSVIWVTKDGTVLSPILNPFVQEELSTPLIIGKNGFFSLDDLRISKGSKDDFTIKHYENKSSVLISKVLRFTENRSRLESLKLDADIPRYQYVKLAYRISDSYFLPDDHKLHWVSVPINAENFPQKEEKGRYIQFKITAFPNENNAKSLRIHSLTVNYDEDETPESPVFLSATPGSGEARLSWIPSTENDVVGYEIYYGTQSGFYICNDAQNGASPIFVPLKQKGKLKSLSFSLKGLHNDTPYFISIRSVDANGNKSAYSRELYVRPSSIDNPEHYSIDY